MNPTLFRFASSAALCLTMAGVLAAQSTSPPTSTAQADQSRMQGRDSGPVAVAGCLMQEKDVAALKQSSGAGSGEAFVLTNATIRESTSEASTGTTATGTTGTGTTASGTASTTGTSGQTTATTGTGSGESGRGMNNMFRIVGLTDELKKHINHHVEIQGTITTHGTTSMGSGSGSASSTGTTGSTATSTTGTASGTTAGTTATGQAGRQQGAGNQMGSGNVKELRATSVRMISASCPATSSQQ